MTQTNTGQRRTLYIEGMSCGHCIQTVTNALSTFSSVRVISIRRGAAVIEAPSQSVANDAIAALNDAGYPARVAEHARGASLTQSPSGCCGGPKCSFE